MAVQRKSEGCAGPEQEEGTGRWAEQQQQQAGISTVTEALNQAESCRHFPSRSLISLHKDQGVLLMNRQTTVKEYHLLEEGVHGAVWRKDAAQAYL